VVVVVEAIVLARDVGVGEGGGETGKVVALTICFTGVT
jgi:hypothetical protein